MDGSIRSTRTITAVFWGGNEISLGCYSLEDPTVLRSRSWSAAILTVKRDRSRAVREALAAFRRKTFEMIVHENPCAANVAEMPFDRSDQLSSAASRFQSSLA